MALPSVGYTVAVTFLNYVTYSMWTLGNKHQFKNAGQGMTISLTAFQMLVAGALAWIAVSSGIVPRPTLTANTWKSAVLPLGLARSADIGFGNAALSIVSVALQQIVKSTIPVYVCILSVFVLNRHVSLRVWATLVPVVGGTLMAAMGEMSATFAGLTSAVLSCVARASKKIINDSLLHGSKSSDGLTPTQIMMYEAPVSGAILLLVGVIFEGNTLSDKVLVYDELPSPMNPDTTRDLLHLLASNIALGMLVYWNQWSYISIIDCTSAMTCGILMNLKMVLLICLSVRLFGTHLSSFNMCGIAIAFSGCVVYGYEKQQPSNVTIRKILHEPDVELPVELPNVLGEAEIELSIVQEAQERCASVD